MCGRLKNIDVQFRARLEAEKVTEGAYIRLFNQTITDDERDEFSGQEEMRKRIGGT
jgi:hypothetical protein